uniref:Small ribosomal subunit protein uS14c n=1 Tax=Tydemania expeditionis TaxID=325645 RepID=A0A0D6E1I8_TYDEX|nr:30S ribosomal protein S14 [Tydemania expeditionis]CEO91086.1 30S ribosomal protein S14 [Tydemania expeditionis]
MSKKSLIERQRKRQFLVHKYFQKRQKLKKQIQKTFSLQEKFEIQQRLRKFPRDSSYVRLHNRCSCSGRPRSFYRDFQLSRHFFREMAVLGFLPGVRKASW